MEQLKKFLMILCLSAFIFTAGCNKDDKPDDPTNTGGQNNNNGGDGDDWDFLKVGNKWEYARYWNMGIDYPPSQYEITDFRTNSPYDDDDDWGGGTDHKDFKVGIDYYWFENDDFVSCDIFGLNIKELHFPTIYKNYYVGQKWSEKNKTEDILNREVVSVNETVIVPLGTFNNCIKIVGTYTKRKSAWSVDGETIYFHKKYGIIKHEYIDLGDRDTKDLSYIEFLK